MNYAFFDVDNTIYNGYTGTDLINYLADNGFTDNKAKLVHDAGVTSYEKREIDYAEISQIALNAASLAVRKFPLEEADFMVERMLSEKEEVFQSWVEPTLDYLRKKDYGIFLISAGPDLVIKQIAEMINADGWFATPIKHENGKYVGHPPVLLNDQEKVKTIRTLIDVEGMSHFSIAFGDSPGDAPMLESVDKAFVVESEHHKEIITIAKEKNWVVFNNPKQIITALES